MTLQEKLITRWWAWVKKQDDARIAGLPPTPGIEEIRDIAYIDDGHRGHLLDIYCPEGTKAPLPVIIDIHGGGFTYGYKELNKPYNLYLASLGFTVVSLSYRLAPEVRFIEQVRDISAALRWIAANGAKYPCDMENIFVTGDSAGGLFAMLLPLAEQSPALQKIYGIRPSGLQSRAVGLVSGALAMNRGLSFLLSKPVFGPGYKRREDFTCLEMKTIPDLEKLPPCYMVTSRQDFVRGHSLAFAQALQKRGIPHELRDWPKIKGKPLTHVFPVLYPSTLEESVQTTGEMIAFFRRHAVETVADSSAAPPAVKT
jgi:acetyl esterase/lipase